MKKNKYVNNENKHIRVLFASAINYDALEKALQDPEFLKVIKKVKY